MTSSLSKKITVAALIMMASVLLSRIIGLLREMIIAHLGGAAGDVDAYNVAFVIPEILNHIVASGFLSITFIPIFTKYLAQDNEAEGWRIFSIIFCVFGAVLTLLVALAWLLAPQLIALIAPGLTDPAIIGKAVRMTRIIMPAQLFFFAGSLLMAVQFAKERFKRPALAPLLYNLGIILGGVLLHRWVGIEGFAWGVLAGALAGNLLIQYQGARQAGMRFSFLFELHHPELKKYILLTLPLMLGLTMTFSTEFFTKFFGSYLPEGGIAALNYGLRVMLILVGFFGQAAGVAAFPYLARLAAEGKMAELNQLLNDTLRRYIAIVIPVSTLFMVLSHEVIRMLFQRGRFDALATARTSEVLIFLMIGAFAFAAQTVVVRGYYAVQNTLFPTIAGTLAVLASVPIYWLGMNQMGIRGVALAISLSAILQSSLLYVLWNHRSQNVQSGIVYRLFAKMIFLSVIVGVVLYRLKLALASYVDATTLGGSLLMCLIIGAVFVVMFVASGFVFRIEEVKGFARRLLRLLVG
ncbi:murein biosynthesis integral membrane protein MurJ [candidate division KSB1 bacterium]|nr:murein biosynthesis integral membrane protein MurJ [candidate division KSB1 bacterium]